jgi:hypothetical protein
VTFHKGVSGNLNGRPVGARSKATKILDGIVYKNLPNATQKLADAANNGEHWALQLMLKPLLPQRAATPFELPKLESAADAPAAIKTVLEEIANGAMPAAEGAQIIASIEAYARSAVYDAHEQRLKALEDSLSAYPRPEKSGGENK